MTKPRMSILFNRESFCAFIIFIYLCVTCVISASLADVFHIIPPLLIALSCGFCALAVVLMNKLAGERIARPYDDTALRTEALAQVNT